VLIDCGICVLRKFETGDAPLVAQLANDRDVWINLRDRFPHPYELEHGEAYVVAAAATQDPPTSLAICVDGRAVGSVGVTPGKDIERVHNVASIRVLEKARFIREGLMKQSAIKDGVVQDQYLYASYA
jgi:ribosomal-protein-alanine N-acetyltransferase